MGEIIFALFCTLTLLIGCGGQPGTSASWTWKSGSSSTNQAGSYGSKAVAATSNTPGSRENAATWTDSSGNFWLFGGVGYDGSKTTGDLNGFWEYSTTTSKWTWIGGSDSANQTGTYGTMGTANSSNLPGARTGAASWTDSSGVFWLFGGTGYDADGNSGSLNDMWKYSPTQTQWTWMKGSSSIGASSVYGTKGSAEQTNVPSGRYRMASWMDTGGDLWIFGGCDAEDSSACYNDLWVYNPSTNLWAWMSGMDTSNQAGSYGTQNTAALSNTPGSRYGASSWVDSSNNFWLFGGYGMDISGYWGYLNDLWKYNTGTGEWTWISGSSSRNSGGTYGTKGASSSSNIPGGRIAASTWIDSSNDLWLYGGNGYVGTSSGYLNDLWKYTPSTGNWTWVGGASTNNSTGVYGTQGNASTSNTPGARYGSAGWVDSSKQFWLFGGYYYFGPTSGQSGYLNDLW
jgi:N-acetylneuraminic acid mutarotase